MKTTLYVNQRVMIENRKSGARKPPITVREGDKQVDCYRATINGPSRLVYSPDKPHPNGARLWLETDAPVTIDCEA